jgi:general secretion pathway protein B
MSYILDALRRADAERSRGAVPGLHAQSLPGDSEPAARNYRPLIWAAGGAGVLVVAGLVIMLFGPWQVSPAPDARVALAPAPELAPIPRDNAPAQPAQGELPPSQPGAIDPGARPVEPPMGRAAPTPQAYPPVGVQPHSVERPVAPARVATLEPRADARPTAAVQARPPVEHYGAAMPTTPPPAPARSNAISNINDLPPNVRSQLPRLAVGGAIYSETPSARMVILNGQVFHEGEKPAADTVLEQIRLKSAILNFRGQRYEVSF